jgi:hypothetical protein
VTHNFSNALINFYDWLYEPNGAYTVSSHGNERGFSKAGRDVPVELIASDIMQDPNYAPGETIILLACNTGDKEYAKELARLTGSPVIAPTGYVWGGVDGQRVRSKDGGRYEGQFRQYNPDGTVQNPYGVPDDRAVVGLTTDENGNPSITVAF